MKKEFQLRSSHLHQEYSNMIIYHLGHLVNFARVGDRLMSWKIVDLDLSLVYSLHFSKSGIFVKNLFSIILMSLRELDSLTVHIS